MQEGEVLAVVEEDKGDGWTRVRRNNGDEGYIPTSYVTIALNKWQTHEEHEKNWSLHKTVCSSSHGTNHKEATALWSGPLVYPEEDPNMVLHILKRREGQRNGAKSMFLMAYKSSLSYCNPNYVKQLNHKVISLFDIMSIILHGYWAPSWHKCLPCSTASYGISCWIWEDDDEKEEDEC